MTWVYPTNKIKDFRDIGVAAQVFYMNRGLSLQIKKRTILRKIGHRTRAMYKVKINFKEEEEDLLYLHFNHMSPQSH